MQASKIEFYLYCDWKDFPPSYRIYFDDTLLTERTYIWDNERYVLQEILNVFADNTLHTITIEQVGFRSGTFRLIGIKTDLDINVKIA